MADSMIRRLVIEQRKRLVASILGACESELWWRKLTSAEQDAYRDKVRSSIGVYHDLILDIIKISGDDSLRNEHAIELIGQVHASQVRLERKARGDG